MSYFRNTIYVSLLVLLLAGCRGDEPKRVPDTMPDVYGYISAITANDDDAARAVVMVRAVEGIDAPHTNANITIDDETLIEDATGKELKLEQLSEGQQIQAWLEGDVMESMPVQGYAKAIRVKTP